MAQVNPPHCSSRPDSARTQIEVSAIGEYPGPSCLAVGQDSTRRPIRPKPHCVAQHLFGYQWQAILRVRLIVSLLIGQSHTGESTGILGSLWVDIRVSPSQSIHSRSGACQRLITHLPVKWIFLVISGNAWCLGRIVMQEMLARSFKNKRNRGGP